MPLSIGEARRSLRDAQLVCSPATCGLAPRFLALRHWALSVVGSLCAVLIAIALIPEYARLLIGAVCIGFWGIGVAKLLRGGRGNAALLADERTEKLRSGRIAARRLALVHIAISYCLLALAILSAGRVVELGGIERLPVLGGMFWLVGFWRECREEEIRRDGALGVERGSGAPGLPGPRGGA